MKKFVVENHAESYLPEAKNWKLIWADEFDGNALDETKWNYRLNYWGKKMPAFTTEGVELDGDSHMKINLLKKGDDYYSAHLQTGSNTFDNPRTPEAEGFWPFGKKGPVKFMHRYGYYEIRCRLPRNSGWHAAFWLQAPGIGSHPDPRQCGVEIDVMENYRQHTENLIICGVGYGGYHQEELVWPGHFEFPYEETADGWHYYGVDWSHEGYIFYADGKEIGRQMEPEVPASQVEQFLLVSTECHGYARMFGGDTGLAGEQTKKSRPVEALTKAVLPDYFEVDFVRVYDEVSNF